MGAGTPDFEVCTTMMIRHTNGLLRNVIAKATAMLLAGLLSSTVVAFRLDAQAPAVPDAKAAKAPAPTHYHPNRFPKRAESYYGLVWGLDSLSVKAVESGALIRFSYRILDPEK